MSRQFTSQQVATHNQEHPGDKYAVINGDVYRIGLIPFNKCPMGIVTVEASLTNDVDVSLFFGSQHKDGSTVRLLKSTLGCQVGTIVQEPAGTQQGQHADHAQPGQRGNNGHHAQNGHNGQGQGGQPDADDDDDEGGTAAERRRREEARKRRLRKTYNPLRQDPDDADEYPADAVAMGYLPDWEGRRWRERRMRLSRFIQYMDLPAIDEEDVGPALAADLDLDFAKEIRYQRNLKGGEARGCTGSFRVARPPPSRSQLRPRDGGRTPGGPPPRDPPDSDADDDDDDDDAPDVPAARARQVQLEGRVRRWFPSNSNRTGPGPTQLATPPVTPLNPLPQQIVQNLLPPPPPPPQSLQRFTPEQEQEIAKQRRKAEKAAADKAIAKKQKDPAVVKETVERFWTLKKGNKATQNKPPGPKKAPTRKQDEEARKRRQEERRQEEQRKKDEKKKLDEQKKLDEKKKRDEQKKKRDEEKKKRDEEKKKKDELDAQKRAFNERRKEKEAADAAKRQRENEAVQKAADEQQRRIREDTQRRLKEMDPQAVQDATRRAEEQRQQEANRNLENMREDALSRTKQLAEQGNQEIRDRLAREQQEGQRSQAEIREQYMAAVRATYAEQQRRINDFIEAGYTRKQATTVVGAQYGGLVEDPDKVQNKKGTITTPKGPKEPTTTTTTTIKTPPKRPAETTEGGQDSNKKVRWEDQQQAKTDQAGGGSGGKYADSSRPWTQGDEPWNRGKAPQKKAGFPLIGEDEEDSPDELALAVTTGTGRPAGGHTQPARPDVPPPPTTTGTAVTTPSRPTTTTTTTTTTTGGGRRSDRRRGVGLPPGTKIPAELLARGTNKAGPSNRPSTQR